MKFSWNDTYSVGIDIFDEQHKHFFELANDAYRLLDNGNTDHEKLISIVNDMINYLIYHLSSEEDAFKLYKYPETDSHIQAHNLYRTKIKELLKKIQTADTHRVNELNKKLVDFATEWLSSHILSTDQQYSSFFHGRDISA